MKTHQLVTAVIVVLLLGAIVRSPLASRDLGADGEPTPLGLVRASPDSFLGKELDCIVQVQSVPAAWNPYVTRFGTQDFVALSVWSDEQALWLSEEFEHPFGLVFARRGSPVEPVFRAAKPYQRYRVRGRVRECFLGRAWIEIETAERLDGELGEGAILHASRAVQLIAAEQWKLALADLERALASDLPTHVRAALGELRAVCDAALANSTR